MKIIMLLVLIKKKLSIASETSSTEEAIKLGVQLLHIACFWKVAGFSSHIPIINVAWIIQFLNMVYVSYSPSSSYAYDSKSPNVNNILTTV
jgi:hypothetical protein